MVNKLILQLILSVCFIVSALFATVAYYQYFDKFNLTHLVFTIIFGCVSLFLGVILMRSTDE